MDDPKNRDQELELVSSLFLDYITDEQFVEQVLVKRELVLEEVPFARAIGDLNQAVVSAVIGLTFSFEGAGYTQVTGDFDGQGLSWGGLQWCLGQGSLQPLLRTCAGRNRAEFDRCLGDIAGMVYDVASGRVAWPKLSRLINFSPPKYVIKSPYKERFQALGRVPEFIKVQQEACSTVVRKALNYCMQYGLKSARALALCFDICVQNGSIHGIAVKRAATAKANGVKEEEFLKILALGVADSCNPKWRNDVLARKMACATGTGTVHGASVSLAARGIDMQPWAVTA